jgi:mannose-6-phosphate isomerase-like protein (cupin superfamily)
MDARVDKVSVTAALQDLTEYWSQQLIGTANDTMLKVAKGTGSTQWHSHDDQDETFLVFSGTLTVQLRDRSIVLEPGDVFIVPKGVEHCPVAPDEARFLILGTSITSTKAGGKPDWSFTGNTPPTE